MLVRDTVGLINPAGATFHPDDVAVASETLQILGLKMKPRHLARINLNTSLPMIAVLSIIHTSVILGICHRVFKIMNESCNRV